MRKVILYLASNPSDTVLLPELWREITEVKREIRHSKHGKQFDFQLVYAANPKDLRTEMVELKPQIVHFSGHGAGADGIVLTDDSGESNLVTGEMLQDFFGQFDCVECIVLNACYSIEQAEPLARCVRYVIGIHDEVDDKSASDFAASFYHALGNGYSVEAAFALSRSFLNMKNKPIEFHPQLLKREDNEPQPESDVHKSPISAFDPIKAAAESFLNLVARPITQLHGLSAEARKDINSLLYQWIAVSTIALVFAAGVSTGPADRLFNTFRAVALVTMPLLQWLTIKYWMRGVPWWLWFFGTILGWACGWYLASPINRILISDILGISYLSSADLSCWYLDCDEFSYSDSRIILTMINVSLSFLTIGGLVGLIQGVLLQRSFLRISRIKWMLASALGMFFGSLIGIPVILFYSSIVNTSPDDFLFALILGLTYGTITGRVLLPHMDTYLKPNQSASSTQTLGHETVSDRLFIVLRSSASRFWMYLGQVFAPVKLSDLRRSLINNLPNWALLCAILAFGSLLVDRDMPLTVLMAVITAFLGYRAMFEISESQGLLKGRRRAIASLLIGLTILAVVLFPSYIRLFFR